MLRSLRWSLAGTLLLVAPLAGARAQSHGGAASDTATGEPGAHRAAVGSICEFSSGPRAGQRQRLRGEAATVPVGSPCTDGAGSTGRVVSDDLTSTGPTPPDPRRMSTTCEFQRGPRAGHRLRGIMPTPIGSQCTDGDLSNYGVAVEDAPTPPARENQPLGGIPAERCRLRSNGGAALVCRETPGERLRPASAMPPRLPARRP